ncbi:MAG: S-adenosylmethionine:tRNA ribosyltransferase-isomerase, partial [Christensenellaceae bacterium]|nr:S-adenosylmethionine:tRNA ribosyltransferase-isomerase [Christensenellaceae bacterium]
MNTHDFYYDLPESFIAQTPVEPRDSSKLMVYDRETDTVSHRVFRDIREYLKAGDVLVINNTKVIPARLFGKKREGGREVEFLLLKKLELDVWEIIMRPGKKLRIGDYVDFSDKLCAEILVKGEDGVSKVRFYCDGVFEAVLDELGQMPLPPYITERLQDKTRYQTVYAKQEGSAAAPTAGLHFTPQLMEEIRAMGVE